MNRDYFYLEDKMELEYFLYKLEIKGYEDLWAPDRLTGAMENISRYLDSLRRFNEAIPTEALSVDGERLYPLWANMNLAQHKDAVAKESLEVCIDHSEKQGFHVKAVYMTRIYPANNFATAGVTLDSPKARLPDVRDMLRLTDKVDKMRKKCGLNYLEQKFSSEDKIVKRCLRKNFLRQ